MRLPHEEGGSSPGTQTHPAGRVASAGLSLFSCLADPGFGGGFFSSIKPVPRPHSNPVKFTAHPAGGQEATQNRSILQKIPLQKWNYSANSQLAFDDLPRAFRCIISSQQECEREVAVSSVTIPIGQVRKLRPRGAQSVAPHHTVDLRQNQGVLTSHHTSLSLWRHNECDHQHHTVFHSSQGCLMVLTIQLYIELHLHSRVWASPSEKEM